jgi:hypothetical protein
MATEHPPLQPPGEYTPEEYYQGESLEAAVSFYADSLHVFSGLYSSVLFFGELQEDREPMLRAKIKVSPQMLKAICLLTRKHVREYESAIGPISLPGQVLEAWDIRDEKL